MYAQKTMCNVAVTTQQKLFSYRQLHYGRYVTYMYKLI